MPQESRPSPATSPAAANSGFWPHGWWKLMELRVGVLPVPVLVLLTIVLGAFISSGKFPASGKTPSDVCTMLAVLAVGGFVCAEIGKRIPFVKDIGGGFVMDDYLMSRHV